MANIANAFASPIPSLIYKAIEDKADDWRRPHLGASVIGKDCKRELWFSFRWAKAPQHDGRLLRLFETGNLFEDRIVSELAMIGITVTDRQKYIVTGVPLFGGSIDGIGEGFPESKAAHLVEFKTHSAKSFSDLSAKGVQESKPQHWVQMQVYMGALAIDRAYYIAVNKDTDELYAERIRYDKAFYVAALNTAQAIIRAAMPPARIADNPARFACRFCQYKQLCHGRDVPEVNCRTCCHSDPSPDGRGWICSRHGLMDTDAQKEGCKDHLFIPPLLNLETVDAGEDWVKYENDWVNCRNSKEYRA